MNRLMLSAVIAVLMAAVFVPVAFSDSAAADPGETVINFRVIAVPAPEEFDTVRVSVDDAFFGNISVDTDGTFSVTVLADTGEVNIKIVMAGYETISYIFGGDSFENDVVIDLDTYSGGTVFVMLGEGWAYITGEVQWRHNKTGVGAGVTVEAYDAATGNTYHTKTRSDGTFMIRCPVNVEYVISVVHRVYAATEQTVYLETGGYKFEEPFILDPKESATFLFGFDLTHSMMIIGGIAGLFLLIFVILYRIHIGRHPEKSKIHSDSKKKDQE